MPGCKKPQKKHQHETTSQQYEEYTCSMHPTVKSDKPGKCPICVMDMVKKQHVADAKTQTSIESLALPSNEFVVSNIPVTTLERRQEQIEIKALGNINYDTREAGTISSRVSGRIEKLYVRYRYQKISRGQHILDIYSPELLTAQQNLLFLLKNDAANNMMVESAKQKLLLLGMSSSQLNQVIKTGKPLLSIAVYSNYSGHIHEAVNGETMRPKPGAMKDISLLTSELPLKEGMYIQKGQSIFTVFNPSRAWVVLNIFDASQSLVKKGNPVRVVPETAPGKDFRATIDFIEPFYRNENKTQAVRIYFDNSKLKIPIGSQVTATIFGNTTDANWLPFDAVLSLGLNKIVFLKMGSGFKAHKIEAGMINGKLIQVMNGLQASDSVALNAQYLMDSESFIKLKE
jgi:Cu(I)/Ag(I) efflux system membrane fusion protein